MGLGKFLFKGFIDAPRNIGKAFGAGFDIGHGGLRRLFSGYHGAGKGAWSLGGMLSTPLGAAAIGAGVGLAASAKFENVDPAPAAATGAVVGAVGLPAAGALGAATVELGASLVDSIPKIGAAGLAAGKILGTAAKTAIGGPGFTGGAMAQAGNLILNPVQRHARAFSNVADSLFKYTPKREIFDAASGKMKTTGGLKITPWGWGLLGAGAAVHSARGALAEADRIRMGTVDPYITRATPRPPSYYDNAGATGDLVFALNANRRG